MFNPSARGKFLLYWKDYFLSQIAAGKQKTLFKDVATYCMFIGHGRSGHTLHGALLNAHPEPVVANELDALYYVKRGISRDQLYALILAKDRWFNETGSKSHNFTYTVANQWQGRFQGLKVIGDKKGGVTTARLQESPGLLDKLRAIVGVPLRMIHIVRNPFDNISTMARYSGRPLEQSVEKYFKMADCNLRLIEQYPSEVLTLRHEDFISRPKEPLRRMVEFVGLVPDESYLSDCASVIFEKPSKTRQKTQWDTRRIDAVRSRIKKYPFLQGYTFES